MKIMKRNKTSLYFIPITCYSFYYKTYKRRESQPYIKIVQSYKMVQKPILSLINYSRFISVLGNFFS